MVGSLGQSAFRLIRSTSSCSRPWQTGVAVAVGVGCGLLLQHSVLAILTLGIAFFLPIHFPILLLTTVACAFLGPTIEPIAGKLGIIVLSQPDLKSFVARLHAYPLVAWLKLDNTIVQGCLMLGAAQFLPTYLAVRTWMRHELRQCLREPKLSSNQNKSIARIDPAHEQELVPDVAYAHESDELPRRPESPRPHIRIGPPVESSTGAGVWSPDMKRTANPRVRYRIDSPQPVGKNETANSQVDNAQVDDAQSDEPNSDRSPVYDDLAEQDPSPVERVESFLADCSNAEVGSLPARDVAARASELASLVDEMLEAFEFGDLDPSDSGAPPAKSSPGIEASDERRLPEHFREDGSHPVVPNSEQARKQGASPTRAPTNDDQKTTPNSMDEKASMSEQPREFATGQDSAGVIEPPEPSETQSSIAALRKTHEAHDPSTADTVSPHEEALRYLLHHLKEIKDKA